MPQPRLHRMRRPARLASARSWLDSGGEATVRAYARRYGVDRYTAYDELTMLGVTLPAKDEQWSVRPPPVPKRPKRSRRQKQEPEVVDDGLPSDWMEWGGELMFVAGFTSGGAPYGIRIEDFPPEDLPEELKDLAEVRRALRDELAARHAWDDSDVPF
jgi:hypothetical protein